MKPLKIKTRDKMIDGFIWDNLDQFYWHTDAYYQVSKDLEAVIDLRMTLITDIIRRELNETTKQNTPR